MKDKVKKLVAEYKRIFPEEYEATLEVVKEKRALLKDEKFGQTEGDHVMDRHLLEYPEVLYNIIYNKLTPEEFVDFNSVEGQRWFARTFKEFKIPDEI